LDTADEESTKNSMSAVISKGGIKSEIINDEMTKIASLIRKEMTKRMKLLHSNTHKND